MVNVHARYLDQLETEGWLDRALEFLPTDKQIAERQAGGSGLRTPEFAVMIAYTKNANIAEIMRDRPPDDAACSSTTASSTSRRRCASGSTARSSATPAASRDRGDPTRQPDGEPVGDLVRPPHDGGHRCVGHRRRPGVARRRGRSSTSPSGGPRSVSSRRWISRRTTDGALPRLSPHGRAVLAVVPPSSPSARSTSPPRSARFREPVRVAAPATPRAYPGPIGAAADASGRRAPSATACRRTGRRGRRTGGSCTRSFDMVELADRGRGRAAARRVRRYWEVFDRLELLWLWDGDRRAAPLGSLADPGARRAARRPADACWPSSRPTCSNGGRTGTVDAWLAANERAVAPCDRQQLVEIRRADAFDITNLSVALRQLRNLAQTSVRGA